MKPGLMFDKCECMDEKVKEHAWLFSSGYWGGGKRCALLFLPMYDPDVGTRKERYWCRHNLAMAKEGGYTVGIFNPRKFVREIYAINKSKEIRSGGAMSPAYRRTVDELILEFNSYEHKVECEHHWVLWYGCFEGEKLVAYIRLIRMGELAIYARILGHRDHLDNGCMFLMHHIISKALLELPSPVKYTMYGAWASGGEGLQFWKKRCQFLPATLPLEK